MVARRLVVSGRVQGVWFRQSARQEAERLGVTGWVRNLPDGTVEAWAQGDAAAVDALVAWCGRGPSRADVTGVEADDVPPEPALRGFEVR